MTTSEIKRGFLALPQETYEMLLSYYAPECDPEDREAAWATVSDNPEMLVGVGRIVGNYEPEPGAKPKGGEPSSAAAKARDGKPASPEPEAEPAGHPFGQRTDEELAEALYGKRGT